MGGPGSGRRPYGGKNTRFTPKGDKHAVVSRQRKMPENLNTRSKEQKYSFSKNGRVSYATALIKGPDNWEKVGKRMMNRPSVKTVTHPGRKLLGRGKRGGM